MREAHVGLLVKDREIRDLDIAGIRKSGRETTDLDEAAKSPLRLLLAAMSGGIVSGWL